MGAAMPNSSGKPKIRVEATFSDPDALVDVNTFEVEDRLEARSGVNVRRVEKTSASLAEMLGAGVSLIAIVEDSSVDIADIRAVARELEGVGSGLLSGAESITVDAVEAVSGMGSDD